MNRNPFEAMPAVNQEPKQLPPSLSWQSTGGLGKATAVLLYVVAAINGIVALLVITSEPVNLRSGPEGLLVFLQKVNGLSSLESLAGIALIVIYCMWIYRASSNLYALNPNFMGQYSPGWAVGWWFIPFVNIVIPYFVVKEIYLQSMPETEPRSSGILLLWWLTYLLRPFPALIVGLATESVMVGLFVFFAFVPLPAILCAIIVRRIDRWQDARALRT
jgi:hypothetical protein